VAKVLVTAGVTFEVVGTVEGSCRYSCTIEEARGRFLLQKVFF